MVTRIIFPIFWIAILLVFYLLTHDQLINALFSGRHLIFLGIMGLLFTGLVFYLNKNTKSWIFSGMGGWLLVLIMMVGIQLAMICNFELMNEVKIGRWIGLNLIVGLITPLFFISSFKLGTLIYKSHPSFVHLGIGIIVHTYLIWIFARFEFLNPFFIAAIFVVPFAIKPLHSIKLLKLLFIKRLPNFSSINYSGWASIFIILVTFSLNLVESIRPFPKGYDALTLYYNLIASIHQKKELVDGIGAFYGILYTGSGLFASNLNILSFAFYPCIILCSGILFFSICRKFIDINLSLVGFALLMSVPLINSVAGLQQKIDGLVFLFSLLIVKIFTDKFGIWKNAEIFLWGSFLGFLLGIKFSALIFIAGVIIIFWAVIWNKYTLIPMVFATFFIIIEFQLDAFSEMRNYHSYYQINSKIFLWLALLGFLSIIIWQRDFKKEVLKKTMILFLGFVISILPMVINNFMETGKLDRQSLLFGNKVNVTIDIDKARNIINKENGH